MRTASLAALAVACAVVALPALARMPAPLVAAHRGGALLWPENSLLAFRNALALGADYLELDVHLSGDGEVMVIHDPTLDRTSTGRGPVRERTLAELRPLRLKDGAGAVTGEGIPTLDEVAAVAAAGGRPLLVEIKVDARGRRYPGIEEAVLAVLDRHAPSAASVVMAFEAETWRRVRALRPDVRAGALYSPRSLAPGDGVARALAAAAAAGVAYVGLHESLVTPGAVAQARAADLLLGAWTVNEPEAMRRLAALPIAILTTDRPDLARALFTDRRTP